MPTTGIEPVTFALRERRSTTELNRHGDIKRKNSCQRFQSLFRSLVKYKRKEKSLSLTTV